MREGGEVEADGEVASAEVVEERREAEEGQEGSAGVAAREALEGQGVGDSAVVVGVRQEAVGEVETGFVILRADMCRIRRRYCRYSANTASMALTSARTEG